MRKLYAVITIKLNTMIVFNGNRKLNLSVIIENCTTCESAVGFLIQKLKINKCK